MAFFVGCEWGGGQVAAIDGGTTGCIRDHNVITEELSQQAVVRCFTTASASAREFHQRLQEASLLNIGGFKLGTIGVL